MRKEESISLKQFFRLVVILLIGVLVTLYVPTFEFVSTASLSSTTVVVILFIFLSGFLVNQAIERRAALKLGVSVELSRLRRLVHITEPLPGRTAWKNELREQVVAYSQSVGVKKFIDYDEAHIEFREITHQIYEFKPKTRKEELVFNEMLEVTRDLAYYRQQVAKSLISPISVYTKSAGTFMALIAVILLLGARSERESIFFIIGTTTSILLVLDIFFNLDRLSKDDCERFTAQYRQNAKDIKKG